MEKIWILLVLVLVMMFVLSKQKETFEQKRCLLLTCCVDVRDEKEKRIRWYTDSIHKYLENTKLHVRVIESSGYEFPIEHERFKQYSFKSTLEREKINRDIIPTHTEAESILKANESGILDGFDLVVKITGKYYVPELAEEISKVPEDCGIVYQNSKSSENSQNSEIFGFKKEYINDIFTKMIKNNIFFEESIYNIHEKLNCNSYTIPKKMKVECVTECPHKTDPNILLKEL